MQHQSWAKPFIHSKHSWRHKQLSHSLPSLDILHDCAKASVIYSLPGKASRSQGTYIMRLCNIPQRINLMYTYAELLLLNKAEEFTGVVFQFGAGVDVVM